MTKNLALVIYVGAYHLSHNLPAEVATTSSLVARTLLFVAFFVVRKSLFLVESFWKIPGFGREEVVFYCYSLDQKIGVWIPYSICVGLVMTASMQADNIYG